jgi:hypothetical protein
MAALADFARYVRPEVPGCPEIQILDAILHAGIEFCKRTKIQRETVTVSTVADTARYDLTAELASGTEPDEVLSVAREGADDLTASSEQDFLDLQLDQSGQPQFFYLDGNDLVLGRIPSGAEDLTVTVKARPAEGATALPDELYRRYRTQLAAGAKAFLMMMDKQPWTNLQQAAIHSAVFQGAIDEENLRYAKGGGATPLRTVAQFM